MLRKFEHKIYSQNGADGVISFLLDCVGRDSKYYVEFGVENGTECNTRYLREHAGFTGLMMDNCNENRSINLYKETVTAANINGLFEKYGVPADFALLSIDIDYNDFWIWKAISSDYKPRIVVIEYNATLPPPISATVPYDSNLHWDGTSFFGASLCAMSELAAEKGYTLVYCDQPGVNAYFIRNQYRKNFLRSFSLPSVEEVFVPAQYGIAPHGAIYSINGFTIHGHGKFDQSIRQFQNYPTGDKFFIEGL